LLLTIITFFSTFAGGILATKFRLRLEYFTALAAGVLIGVPLFELLPESLNLANKMNISLEIVMYIVALGFVFLFILERYISVHKICEEDVCKNVRHPKGGFYGAFELSAHSFMDGFAIGIGFQFNFSVGIIVAIAVISHDFSDGLNTATLMLKSGNSLKSTLKMLLLDACTPILGVLVTFFFSFPEIILIFILPFFAGGFLYLGASDLLPDVHEKSPSAKALILSIFGILIALIISIFLNI
ncbi:MAG: ZIP family metal transporter, partial [Promethearchaeota archaeon]